MSPPLLFSPFFLHSDGSIDRPALGAIVFSDPEKMRRLTGIVWPAVRHLVVEQREALGQAGVRICVAEAALMLEAGSDAEMDEVWVVFAGEGVVKQRLRERNGWSEEEAEKRIRSQVRIRIPKSDSDRQADVSSHMSYLKITCCLKCAPLDPPLLSDEWSRESR